MDVHLTLLEGLLVLVVLVLLFDKLGRAKQLRRLNELEQKVRDQDIHARVMRSTIPELVERANRRWIDKSKLGNGDEKK